jgi:hypothetical protein
MGLYRVLYCSRSRLPEEKEKRLAALRDIIARSEINNRATGLTGALLYTNRCFAQILEGEEEAVAARFARIAEDPRHYHLAIVSYAPAAAREFPDWSMALLGSPQNDEEDALARLLLQEAFAPTPRADTAEALLGYLHGLLHTANGFAAGP